MATQRKFPIGAGKSDLQFIRQLIELYLLTMPADPGGKSSHGLSVARLSQETSQLLAMMFPDQKMFDQRTYNRDLVYFNEIGFNIEARGRIRAIKPDIVVHMEAFFRFIVHHLSSMQASEEAGHEAFMVGKPRPQVLSARYLSSIRRSDSEWPQDARTVIPDVSESQTLHLLIMKILTIVLSISSARYQGKIDPLRFLYRPQSEITNKRLLESKSATLTGSRKKISLIPTHIVFSQYAINVMGIPLADTESTESSLSKTDFTKVQVHQYDLIGIQSLDNQIPVNDAKNRLLPRKKVKGNSIQLTRLESVSPANLYKNSLDVWIGGPTTRVKLVERQFYKNEYFTVEYDLEVNSLTELWSFLISQNKRVLLRNPAKAVTEAGDALGIDSSKYKVSK